VINGLLCMQYVIPHSPRPMQAPVQYQYVRQEQQLSQQPFTVQYVIQKQPQTPLQYVVAQLETQHVEAPQQQVQDVQQPKQQYAPAPRVRVCAAADRSVAASCARRLLVV